MDRKIFVKYIDDHFKWLIDLGYLMNHIDTSIYFEKESDSADQCISFSWAEYNDIKIHAISARKRFNEVENLIKSKTGKFDYTIRLPLNRQILNDVGFSLESSTNDIYLSNEKQVREFSDLVRFFFDHQALPFFNQFKSLEVIGQWLDIHDIQKHSQLLSVNNNSMMLRKLIILKKLNFNEFNSLYERYKLFLIKKVEEGEKVYQEMYKSFSQFSEFFESPLT